MSDAAVTSYLFYSMFIIYWCVTMTTAVPLPSRSGGAGRRV